MSELAPLYRFDSASAISRGARPYQEDAYIADFSRGADVGFAVLADGMGGHAAGDVASQIVVTEVFSELTFQRKSYEDNACALPGILRQAADCANQSIQSYTDAHPQSKGMGATLTACVVLDDALYWISIGDSPLFLFRDNQLQQINEDHSMGPQVDLMVETGALSEADARAHPDRSVLTSALFGERIARIDCPENACDLRPGDTIIIASDGLQYLSEDDIARVLRERPFARSADIVDALMGAVQGLNDPDLDNVTIGLVQVQYAGAHNG
jgi:serine/threonine protein phosphatase PrpC